MKNEKNRRKSAMAILIAVAMIASISVVISPVIANNNASSERTLPPITPPTLSLAPGYCPSNGGSHSYESIQGVSYAQKPGETLTITVNIWIANPDGCVAGEPCPVYDVSPEYINAWIDWDGDGVFESDERVLDKDLTGYLGINYHGTMSTSNIVTIPADAVSSTWMRVNLGWDHDPNDPCEESWSWGDVVDKEINIAIKPPKIEEIIVTGIPNAKNPTINDPSTSTVEKVKLEAKITTAEGFEVTKVSWSGDVTPGEENPYEYSADPGTHGKKEVKCTITYKNQVTGETGTDTKTKEFKLFFEKGTCPNWADDGKPGGPNWFKYWKKDGAVPNMAVAKYDATSTYFGYQQGDEVYLTPYSAGQHYDSAIVLDTHFGTESFGGPTVQGIDCAAEIIAHELYHKWVDDEWSGGSFTGKTDSDKGVPTADCNDELPDFYETTDSHTKNDDTDTYDLEQKKSPDYRRYGDQEYMAMRAGNGARGTASKDWAKPGKQSDPPKGYFSSSYYEPVQAEFTGTYSDQGVDIDGDGLYDYLTVSAEINVLTGGEFHIFARLNDQDTNEITWINEPLTLDAGVQLIPLNFDGLSIRQHGVNGPYSVSLLLDDQFGNEIDHQYDAHTTAPYEYTDFERKDASFSGIYSDYGTDTDGDGLYDYLTTEVEVNTVTPGNYRVEGWLYDGSGNSIIMASNSVYLNAGSQSISLNFDGLAINRNRVDGPYYLRYLSLYGSGQIDFIYDAYTTAPYKFTDFQVAPIPLVALTGNYWNYGTDKDSDEVFDYLTVDAEVMLANPGYCIIKARLMDINGEEIVW
ncbi:MAG: GEVED domain-containing protein, partial [Patescibacteria group bacterium]|nr:GEVED domain-containing protein [Patescibacteria group bacterium]